MIKQMIAATAMTLICVSGARAEEVQAMKLGDGALTCEQIVSEANQQTTVMGGAPAGGVFADAAINAATSAGMQAAIMSGAGRAIPGIGAVGGILGGLAHQRADQQAAAKAVAEKRWYFLNGLYQGKACDKPQAAAH